ncbi:MAG: AAA family ATPase [Ruminobacter sp.]|uniref:AAA family ATPase n=1 Tax=Ruminobacter sp. TaxID=2774296 RepID=UPI001B6FA703|nr:AAA family ATPase [Ruminobacter sp.]MBP3749808.1 AAA family ATPase [Ruminobacter sp.]
MAEESVKLLNSPYGVVAYESFKLRNRAFADKSGIILHLDDDGMTPYPVLLRPRRFGKSTFVQMLKCFYDISYADRYEELFSGTAVYNEHLESHNTYHVLDFDFSGVSGDDKNTLINGFITAVDLGITDFIERYPDFVFNPTEEEKKTPSSFIRSFFKAYKLYLSKKSLYLIIDEYDNFANSILSQDLELFKAITGTGGFLKDFYAAIKDGAKRVVAKTFITGVSSVSLDSLTSGFNISLNVTSDKCFNEYAGFTEDELEKLIPQLVDIEELGVSTDEIIARMKPVYDGYCFSQEAEHTVFNSSMCLYYLRTVQNKQQFFPPEDYMDPASDHDGSKLQLLFDIAENGLVDEIVESYLSNDLFFLDKLAENINLNKVTGYNREQFLSMLYYLGYLTIDKEASDSSSLALKIPNLFMSKLFAQCIADMRLKTNTVFTDTVLDISSLRDVNDDISSFASSCTEFLSGIFTNQVLTHMSEMALNLTLCTKLKSLRGIFVEMQKSLRVVGKGEKFADLVITVNKGKSNQCIYLIELKYVTKTDATEAKIQNTIKDATEQVNTYKTALEFRDKTVKAYAMVFAGSECVYCG